MSPAPSDYRARVYGAGSKGLLAVQNRPPSAETFAYDAVVYRRVLGPLLPADKGSAIFEIGSGAGSLISFLHQEGYARAEGMERSEESEIGRKLGVQGLREGDALAHLALAENAYDCIVAIDVLEHYTKAEIFGVVDAVYKALKPGGRFIWRAPNADGPFFGRVFYGDLTHELPFTKNSAWQLMALAGFRDVQILPDAAPVTGARSFARFLLWSVFSTLARLYLFAESYATGAVLTANLIVVARKAG